ncbi:MAG TPA: hypothetical protein HPP95_12915 [Deltaproteobacteria bacterium]|nr:hypothetical protein [Deltaproteobacteria bacterium]
MIKVKKVWEECDCEGEIVDSSITEDAMTFRELVNAFRREYQSPSATFFDWRAWASSYEDQDYRSGNQETKSIHLADESKAKYWVKAWKTAQMV